MDRGDLLWRLLPPSLRRLPADLAATVLGVALTLLGVFAPGIRDTPVRVLFGLVFVLFLPGYAFIAALFPEGATVPPSEADASDGDTVAEDRDGIDGIERVALSFGLSIAIVPLLGLILNFTPFGIRLVPIIVAVSVFTLVSTWVAAHRRAQLAPEARFSVPYRDWFADARAELLHPDTRTDAVLNVLLVLSVVLATVSVAYAVAVPKQGEAFTELYVLTESEDGDRIADDYPQNFTVGQSKPVVVGVGNHEHRTQNYSIAVELHRVQFHNNSTRVVEQQLLNTFRTGPIPNGGNWTLRHQLTPRMTGQRLRVTYLLYRGQLPPNRSIDTAYRENHLFINVSAQ